MNRIVQNDDCDVRLERIERPFLFKSPFDGEQFVLMLVVSASTISGQEQAALSKELIEQGCRYAVCAGVNCSSWDDSIDMAFLSTVEDFDPPDERLVVTTWHENEPLDDVVYFFRMNTCIYDFVPRNFLVAILGSDFAAEAQVLEALRRHFGTQQ